MLSCLAVADGLMHSGHAPVDDLGLVDREALSSDAVRQGVSPTAQSTSAMAPHDRHTTWWWLSPTRAS